MTSQSKASPSTRNAAAGGTDSGTASRKRVLTTHSEGKVLGVFTLAMINVVAIANLKSLPFTAGFGMSMIIFYAIAALAFFVPQSLVAAELATTYPERGGIYAWVKHGMGARWGFLAVWIQSMANLIWFPGQFMFLAGIIAYIFKPELMQNKEFILAVVYASSIGGTWITLRGMKISGLLSSVGGVLGTIVPGIAIIGIGLWWVLSGNESNVSLSASSIFPNMGSLKQYVLLAAVFLGLAGMEMSANHAQEVQNPRKNFPKAILLSALLIIVVSVLGSLSISILVPKSEMSLATGTMQAFSNFLSAYELSWVTPVIAVFILIGGLTCMTTWMAGPPKGLLAASFDGDLPPFFQKVNHHNMPVNILVSQAAVICLYFTVAIYTMDSIEESYWILTDLAAQVYLIMYAIMFLAAIILRFTQPNRNRPYQVPGGKMGMILISGLGLVSCVFCILMGFVPPADQQVSLLQFELMLILGMLILCAPPFLFFKMRKPHWKPELHDEPVIED